MNHKDIVNALVSINPKAKWSLSGEDLSGLTWQDETIPRPTDKQIMAAIAAYVPPPSLQDQVAALQAQVAALLALQGKK